MAKRVQLIRHAVSAALTFLGREGEVTVDLTNKALRVYDGVTLGGNMQAAADLLNVAIATAGNHGKMSSTQAAELAQALVDIDAAEAAILLRAIKDATPTNNEIVKQDGSGDLSGAGFLAAAVVLLTGAQTLEDKTLTSPDINTPDIDGGTIDGAALGTTNTGNTESVGDASTKLATTAFVNQVKVTSSAQTTYAANAEFAKAHGQASPPDVIYAYGVVQGGHSDLGYSAGDKVTLLPDGTATIGYGLQTYADTNNMYGVVGSGGLRAIDKGFPHDPGTLATGEWDIYLVGLWF